MARGLTDVAGALTEGSARERRATDRAKGPGKGPARLRGAGLRVTLPRLAVLDLMDSTEEHLSADVVRTRLAEAGVDLQRSSVFNVLARLSEAGLLRRVELGGPTRFERQGDEHGHFQCNSCGAIENVAATDVPVPPVAGRIDATFVVHRGLCKACLDRS